MNPENYPIKATLESIKDKILHCDPLLKAYRRIESNHDFQSSQDVSIEDEIVKLYLDIIQLYERQDIH